MKSTSHIQEDMIKRGNFGEGFPKVVHVGMGIIAVAHNQTQLDRLRREALVSAIVFGAGLLALLLGILACVVYQST